MKNKYLYILLPMLFILIGAISYEYVYKPTIRGSGEIVGDAPLLQYRFKVGTAIEYEINYRSKGEGEIESDKNALVKPKSVRQQASVVLQGEASHATCS